MIGVLEEYCTSNPEGRLVKYRGSRVLDVEAGKLGAQNGEILDLPEDVTLFKGGVSRTPFVLKAGTRVWRWRTPLEGRR